MVRKIKIKREQLVDADGRPILCPMSFNNPNTSIDNLCVTNCAWYHESTQESLAYCNKLLIGQIWER